jgi:tetratricopeptide (TPR) repeat protein
MSSMQQPEGPSLAPPLERDDPRKPLRGRDDIVESLTQVLTDTAKKPRVWVLHGMAGAGKTAIAVELAQYAVDRGLRAWWVRAVEQPTLLAGLRAIASELGAKDNDLRRNLGDALWLELSRRDQQWLLVIDNADDASLLAPAGGPPDGTGLLRPTTGRGVVVITSRERDQHKWGSWPRLQPVTTLTPVEGAAVLLDLAPRGGEVHEAEALSERLGGLPLALRLAGQYLAAAASAPPWERDPGGAITTFAAFQRELGERFDAHLFASAATGDVSEANRRNITTTWERSLDLLARRGFPETRPLLRLLACLAEAPIPYMLLLFDDPEILARSPLFPGLTRQRLGRVLTEFQDVELIRLDEDAGASGAVAHTAWLHPLVRDTNRSHLDIQERFDDYRALLMDLLGHATKGRDPEDPKTWAAWQALRAHCSSLLDLPGADRHDGGISPELLVRLTQPAHDAAHYLHATGLYAEAATEYQRVLELRLRVLGEDHPDTLTTRHARAYTLRDQGKRRLAQAEYGDVLERRRRVLGENDPETLSTRHALAFMLQTGGRLAEAQAEYEEVLERRRRVLGEEHPQTLISRHSLAFALQARGRWVEAEAEYREVLKLRRRTLGEEHPQTLISRHSLAFALHSRGELAAAETEYGETIRRQRLALGEDHPDTLGTRHNLGRLLQDQGRWPEAEAEYEDVLRRRRRVLGERDPATLTTRHSLAFALHARGELAKAEAEYREVLALYVAALGEDHPDTLGTRRNLAFVLQDQDRLDEAEAEYQDVLMRRTRVLGPDHPDTLATRHALAWLLQHQGHRAEAEREYRQVLERQEAVLPRDHPDIQATRRNLEALLAER